MFQNTNGASKKESKGSKTRGETESELIKGTPNLGPKKTIHPTRIFIMTLEEIRNKFDSASWMKKIVGRDNFDTIQSGVEAIFVAFTAQRKEIQDLKRRVAELENKAHSQCSCSCAPTD